MFGEPVCPEDKVWVYAQVSTENELEKVEIRARYPAGSGDWNPGDMEPLDDQTYRHPLKAYEEPGTEFFIRAEDVDGNSAKSDVQVYQVEPCATPDTKGPDISGLEASEEELDNDCTYCDPPCEMDVYVNVVDPSGVKWVKLIYIEPGETTEIPAGMTNGGGASYETTLNADDWSQGTLEFYVRASDNHDNISESKHLTMMVFACVY
jgi:hypothetical protein